MGASFYSDTNWNLFTNIYHSYWKNTCNNDVQSSCSR